MEMVFHYDSPNSKSFNSFIAPAQHKGLSVGGAPCPVRPLEFSHASPLPQDQLENLVAFRVTILNAHFEQYDVRMRSSPTQIAGHIMRLPTQQLNEPIRITATEFAPITITPRRVGESFGP